MKFPQNPRPKPRFFRPKTHLQLIGPNGSHTTTIFTGDDEKSFCCQSVKKGSLSGTMRKMAGQPTTPWPTIGCLAGSYNNDGNRKLVYFTYLRDLQPTYIEVIVHFLSTMDIPVRYPFSRKKGLIKSWDDPPSKHLYDSLRFPWIS